MPQSVAESSDGILFVANGIDPMLRWDGFLTEMETAGVAPPTTAVTLAPSGTGSITGTYYAFVRYLDHQFNESDLSPISEGVEFTSADTVNYSNVPVPNDPKILRRQILRNTAGQTGVFYVDVDTADLTSTTLSSALTDSFLQVQTPVALFDQDGVLILHERAAPPSSRAVIAAHLERLFIAGEVVYRHGCVALTFGSKTVTGIGTEWPQSFAGRFLWPSGAQRQYEIESVESETSLTLVDSYESATDPYSLYAIRDELGNRRLLYFSEPGLPNAWPPTNALTLQEDGDEITGLMPKGSFLYVLEKRHFYRFTYQQDPIEDGYIFLNAGRGCVNHRCWAIADDMAYLMDEAGIWAFSSGQETEPLSMPIQDFFEPSRRSKYKIRWEAQEWFHACWDPGLAAVRFFVTLSGTGIPRHALCFDIRLKRWWLEEYPFPIGASCVGLLGGQRRVFLGGPGGAVYVLGQYGLDLVQSARGTVRGLASSPGLCSITDPSAVFGDDLVGSAVYIAQGTGEGQWRKIVSATTTRINLDRPWNVLPDTTSVYQIGGIQWRFRTGWFRWVKDETENPRRLEVQFSPVEDAATLSASLYLDRSLAPVLWGYTQTSEESSGFASTDGQASLVGDLTKPIGFIQKRMDGFKDNYLDGPRLLSWRFDGVSNNEPVELLQVMIDGAR